MYSVKLRETSCRKAMTPNTPSTQQRNSSKKVKTFRQSADLNSTSEKETEGKNHQTKPQLKEAVKPTWKTTTQKTITVW